MSANSFQSECGTTETALVKTEVKDDCLVEADHRRENLELRKPALLIRSEELSDDIIELKRRFLKPYGERGNFHEDMATFAENLKDLESRLDIEMSLYKSGELKNKRRHKSGVHNYEKCFAYVEEDIERFHRNIVFIEDMLTMERV